MSEMSDRHWRRVDRYLATGQTGAARAALESILQREPGNGAASAALSRIAWKEGHVRDAAQHALAAAATLPPIPTAYLDIATALIEVGEVVAARDCLDSPILSQCEDPALVFYHAGLRRRLGQHELALRWMERAAELGLDGPEFRLQRGQQRIICGRIAAAEADLESCLAADPIGADAALARSRLRTQTSESNHLGDLASRLRRVDQGSLGQAMLEFALYKENEDLGADDQAWAALERGNRTMHERCPYAGENERMTTEKLVAVCDSEFVRAAPSPQHGSQPIFIIGLPRSGTTLLDRMLGNHTQVISIGERDDFGSQLRWAADRREMLDRGMLDRLPTLDYVEIGERYLERTQWRAEGKRYFIDKRPWHCKIAGLLGKALPHARFLHLVREPMDVCFSNLRAMLGDTFPFAYDMEAMAAHYANYRKLMDHWHAAMPGRILDVSYADLVRQPTATMTAVLEFCELPWEPACTDPALNERPSATPSTLQVRAAINPHYSGIWRRYAKPLQPLARALRERGIELEA